MRNLMSHVSMKCCHSAEERRKYTEFVASMYQNWDLISLHFCSTLFQLEAWSELDASCEDGSSTGIHEPAKRLCMCLFIFVIVFLSLQMLIQNQPSTLASKNGYTSNVCVLVILTYFSGKLKTIDESGGQGIWWF